MSYHAIDGLRPIGAFSARPSSSTVALVTPKARRWRRRAGQAGLLLAGLVAAGSALALITGTWTTNGSASATTSVNGIT
jgi:CHASE2 domain-containing sensor protein